MNNKIIFYQSEDEHFRENPLDPEMEAQARDFERRLTGLGQTYHQAVWWAAQQPLEPELEALPQQKPVHVGRRFVHACGKVLVSVGSQLVNRSGIDQEANGQDSEQGEYFSSVPPIHFDHQNKE